MERKRPKVIALRNTPAEPLCEQALVDAAIAYANGAELRIEGPDGPYEVTPAEEEARTRAIFVDTLSRIVCTDESLSAEARREYAASARAALAKSLAESPWRLRTVTVRRVVRATKAGLEIGYFEELKTPYNVATRGLELLLHVDRGYGERVCRCQWSGCRRFFLKQQPKKGRPRDTYCSDKHMELGHAERAPKRMKQVRS